MGPRLNPYQMRKMNVPKILPTASRNSHGLGNFPRTAISSNWNATGSTRRRLVADAAARQQGNDTNDVASSRRDRHQCDGRVLNVEFAEWHDGQTLLHLVSLPRIGLAWK